MSRLIHASLPHRLILALTLSILATPALARAQASIDTAPDRVLLQPTPLASTATFRVDLDRPAAVSDEIEFQVRSLEQSYRTGRMLLLVGGLVAAGMLADYAVRGEGIDMKSGSAAGYMAAMGLAGYGGYRMHVSRVGLATAYQAMRGD
jgi:hypothetical protein